MNFQEAMLKLSSKLAVLSEDDRQKVIAELHKRGELRKATTDTRIRDQIRGEILKHPAWNIAQEFVKKDHCVVIDGERRFPIDTVEAVIAEKMSWAYLLTSDEGSFSTDDEYLLTCAGRWYMGGFMLNAIPYVWANEMFKLVVSGELPRHTIAARVPFDSVWFTFQNGVPMSLDSNRIGQSPSDQNFADGILAIQLADRLRLAWLGANKEIPFCLLADVFQGAIFPDEVPKECLQIAHLVLSCLSFINSPYIVLDKRRVCRQARRRMGITGEVSESSIPRFIMLRSPLYKRDHEESHSDIDWKFRWLVRGHHRAQWCPSTRDHKLMWIAPYVKGPPDMPMKTTAYKVVR